MVVILSRKKEVASVLLSFPVRYGGIAIKLLKKTAKVYYKSPLCYLKYIKNQTVMSDGQTIIFFIVFSIAATSLGISEVKTSQPFFVTNTLSSILMPILRDLT